MGLSQQASKLNTLNLISLRVLFGLSVENFDFGFQYNIPLRQINTVFAPSILNLIFPLILVFIEEIIEEDINDCLLTTISS